MSLSLIHLSAALLLSGGIAFLPAHGAGASPAGEPAGPAPAAVTIPDVPLPPEALEEARQYLTLLAEGKVQDEVLFKRSGASGSMSSARREQWRAFVKEIGDWLKHRERDEQGRLVLEVTDSRVDGPLAAFVVNFFDKCQPLDLGVLPIMMHRDDGRWVVAPFLTDFDNTRLPFEKNIRKTSQDLAQWAQERSRQRLEESGDKVERRVAETLLALRKKNQWDEASPEKLLMDWVAALKKRDVLEMAALGEMADSQSSSWSSRLRDAQSFVPSKERSMWEFRLSFALGSGSSLTEALPSKETSSGKIDLGVLNFNDTPGTPSSVSLLSFQVKDSTDGRGRTLFYPRDFSPEAQKEYYAGNMEEKDAAELARRIIDRFKEKMPEKKYATPLEFASDFTECVFEGKVPDVGAFLALKGGECVRDMAAVLKAREEWNRLDWGRYQQNMRDGHSDWERIKRKFSKLVKIDDDRSVLMLYLTGPRIFNESYTSHLVTIERRGDSWGWGEEIGKDKFDKKAEFRKFRQEMVDQLVAEMTGPVEFVPLDQFPASPGKVVAADFKEPDDEVKSWMEKTFGGEGLYQFLNKPYGLGVKDDLDLFLYYQGYEEIRFRNDGQDVRDIVFEWEGKTPREDQTILTALQCGDWAMLGIFIRKAPLKMVAIPLVKKEGKWLPVLTGFYSTTPGRGKDGKFSIMGVGGRNKDHFYGMIPTFCYRAAQVVLDKDFLPGAEDTPAQKQ